MNSTIIVVGKEILSEKENQDSSIINNENLSEIEILNSSIIGSKNEKNKSLNERGKQDSINNISLQEKNFSEKRLKTSFYAIF